MSTDQTSRSGGSWWSEAAESIFSYNGNVMLAAIISLLVVILFVLLLHLYAKWFLGQARRRRRRSSLNLGPYHFHNLALDSPDPPASNRGLDASVIASIPLFVCDDVDGECVICLGGYEDGDVGRCLRRCGHAFHVECLDMWLHSHSTCPICRSPVLPLSDELTGSPLLEIVIDNVAPDPDPSAHEDTGMDGCDESVATPQPSCSCGSQFPAIGSSVKRMITKSERKVHPSPL